MTRCPVCRALVKKAVNEAESKVVYQCTSCGSEFDLKQEAKEIQDDTGELVQILEN